jgi:hypothetical protein
LIQWKNLWRKRIPLLKVSGKLVTALRYLVWDLGVVSWTREKLVWSIFMQKKNVPPTFFYVNICCRRPAVSALPSEECLLVPARLDSSQKHVVPNTCPSPMLLEPVLLRNQTCPEFLASLKPTPLSRSVTSLDLQRVQLTLMFAELSLTLVSSLL